MRSRAASATRDSGVEPLPPRFRHWDADGWTRSFAAIANERGDFGGIGKHDLRPVAAHALADQHRFLLVRAPVGGIGLEAQIEFPEGSCAAVGGRDEIAVLAMSHRRDALRRLRGLQGWQ